MLRIMLFSLLALSACGETVQVEKVTTPQDQPYLQNNATDAVGVAEGDQQVSPFGRPAH